MPVSSGECYGITSVAAQLKETILRRKQVEARTGLSRSTIYGRIQARTFPAPIPLGARAVGWLESEVDAWLTAQIQNRRSAA